MNMYLVPFYIYRVVDGGSEVVELSDKHMFLNCKSPCIVFAIKHDIINKIKINIRKHNN